MTTSDFTLLPQHISPLKYRLTLTPDLERFTFRGAETVDIEVTRSTPEIVLNANEIKVLAASVTYEDGTREGLKTIISLRKRLDSLLMAMSFEPTEPVVLASGADSLDPIQE